MRAAGGEGRRLELTSASPRLGARRRRRRRPAGTASLRSCRRRRRGLPEAGGAVLRAGRGRRRAGRPAPGHAGGAPAHDHRARGVIAESLPARARQARDAGRDVEQPRLGEADEVAHDHREAGRARPVGHDHAHAEDELADAGVEDALEHHVVDEEPAEDDHVGDPVGPTEVLRVSVCDGRGSLGSILPWATSTNDVRHDRDRIRSRAARRCRRARRRSASRGSRTRPVPGR